MLKIAIFDEINSVFILFLDNDKIHWHYCCIHGSDLLSGFSIVFISACASKPVVYSI